MAGFEVFIEVAESNAASALEEAKSIEEQGIREGIPADMWRSLE